MTAMKARGIPIVDVLPQLLASKKNGFDVYYKTDDHWNTYGAYQGYVAVMEGLNRFYPHLKVRAIEESDFTKRIEPTFHNEFSSYLGLGKWGPMGEFVTLVPKPGTTLATLIGMPTPEVRDGELPPLVKFDPPLMRELEVEGLASPSGTLQHVLMVTSSFGAKMQPFFGTHAKTQWRCRDIYTFPEEILERKVPDLVVEEIYIRYMVGAPPQNPSLG